MHLETILAQAGNRNSQDQFKSVSAPLYFSSNFRHDSLAEVANFDEDKQFAYARLKTPTRSVLEETLARLEGGKYAYALSSGMAAIQLVFGILKQNDHVISLNDLYGGTFRYFDYLTEHVGIHFDEWDGQKVADLVALCRPETRLIWLETPSNPTMKEIDIVEVCHQIKALNPEIIIAVDNTFYSPIFQQPLQDGADLVIHSATKYLSGHNDILAGCVITSSDYLAAKLSFNLKTTGANLDPFDSWLLLRSLKTLPLRMKQHQANAQIIAQYLEEEPAVSKVLYPGKGGMISFYIKDEAQVANFFEKLQVISFAESLGGVESLVTLPDQQTHHDMAVEKRRALGITPNLIRFSVGLENATDLIADLRQALH